MAKPRRGKSSFKGHPQANRFTHRYGPDLLATTGPLIPATWQTPRPLREALARAGRPVPPAVSGALILDTGATRTCIGAEAAAALQLTSVGAGTTYGAGGRTQNPIVIAELVISIEDRGLRRDLWFQLPAMVIPDMDTSRGALELTYVGRPITYIGLLGRDILRHTTVEYNGPEGKVTVTFSREYIAELDHKSRGSEKA